MVWLFLASLTLSALKGKESLPTQSAKIGAQSAAPNGASDNHRQAI